MSQAEHKMATANEFKPNSSGIDESPLDIELANVPPIIRKDSVDPYLVAFAEPFDADNPKCVQIAAHTISRQC